MSRPRDIDRAVALLHDALRYMYEHSRPAFLPDDCAVLERLRKRIDKFLAELEKRAMNAT